MVWTNLKLNFNFGKVTNKSQHCQTNSQKFAFFSGKRGRDVLRRDVLPGEEGQEVLGRRGRGRGEDAGKKSEKTDDFIGIFVFLAEDGEVETAVAFAEALAVFVD